VAAWLKAGIEFPLQSGVEWLRAIVRALQTNASLNFGTNGRGFFA
jgi:hypothetical protein